MLFIVDRSGADILRATLPDFAQRIRQARAQAEALTPGVQYRPPQFMPRLIITDGTEYQLLITQGWQARGTGLDEKGDRSAPSSEPSDDPRADPNK